MTKSMVTSEIMSQVDKKIATEFVLNMRLHWASKNIPPSQFGSIVKFCLSLSGINAEFTDGTANAVCSKMERKARLEVLP